MNLFSNPRKLNNFRMALIGAFIIMLVYRGYELATGESENYLSLFPPVLFIILMSFSIRKTNREIEKQSGPRS